MQKLAVARHGLTGHADRPKKLSGGIGAPMQVKGKMLVVGGTMDAQAAQTVGYQGNGNPLRTHTPAPVDGARKVAGITPVLRVVGDPVEQGVGRFKFSQRSDESRIGGSHAPLVVRYGNLTGVVLSGPDRNKKNTGPADLPGRQSKIVYVLGTPVDFSRRAR